MFCLFIATATDAQTRWKPAGDNLKTQWGENLDPSNVLPEYPRPLMERSEWLNLNGLWEYAITHAGAAEPQTFDGQILVPFAIESSLSGVQKTVGADSELWYRREFTVPNAWKNKRILLNFGAVDWKADVFVNDIMVGTHSGGYTPFTFDITACLSSKTKHKLAVRVWDPTDKSYIPHGKQASNPNHAWYTAVTGIWQTVWLEPVANSHITAIKSVPDIDNGVLNITVSTSVSDATDVVEVKLMDKGRVVASAKSLTGNAIRLHVDNPSLWSPSSPYLYGMKIIVYSKNNISDEVSSYAAFRKISVKRDDAGIMRLQLNNKNLFQHGLLDQGWYPDGLYTAPSDEALLFDIRKTKEWGFNMIRKHIKVEPARWYYHCDREGVLVWQDMPSGDLGGNAYQFNVYNGGTEKNRSRQSADNYRREWKDIMDFCMSNPSIVAWIPFNEGWGQFDTEIIAEWTADYDPSRPVNPASGGNHRPCGDILDIHNYPNPAMLIYDAQRVNVLGEYGGIALAVENRLWQCNRHWGHAQVNNADELAALYVKYSTALKALVKTGFSAAVYTQTTDVEGEVNGIMTYDRKHVKIDEALLRKTGSELINELEECGLKDCPASFLIGARCDVGDRNITEPVLKREFNAIQPTCYPYVWKSRDEYDFASFNRWVNWGIDNGMKVIMHMIAGPDAYYNDRIKKAEWETGDLDRMFGEYIKSMITTNGNGTKVYSWNVVNECFEYGLEGKYWNDDKCFLNALGYEEDLSGLDGEDRVNSVHPAYISKAFEYAGKYAEGRLELRETQFELSPDCKKTKAIFQLIKHLRAKGVRVDALGFQCHLTEDSAYNYNNLIATANKFRELGGLELFVTELDITNSGKDLELQKRQYRDFIAACRKAGISQVYTWGIADNEDKWWLMDKHPLLFDEQFRKKPAYYGVMEELKMNIEIN
jgi:GH35 family endo-1,4-beta-xylanase